LAANLVLAAAGLIAQFQSIATPSRWIVEGLHVFWDRRILFHGGPRQTQRLTLACLCSLRKQRRQRSELDVLPRQPLLFDDSPYRTLLRPRSLGLEIARQLTYSPSALWDERHLVSRDVACLDSLLVRSLA